MDFANPNDAHGDCSSVLQQITLQMTSTFDLGEVLTTITQGLVCYMGAAFARIWLLGSGDLCAECFKASDCVKREQCLHLRASAGMYTRIDGEYRRVPLGALKIGRIAQGWGPIWTNDVLNDERIPNKQWIGETGLKSFAGYPLIFRSKLLGVLGMFSHRIMSDEEFDRLALFANQAAIAIKNAQLVTEVENLKNQLKAENVYLQEEIRTQHNFEEIIGETPALKKVLKSIETVAPTDASVLIHGETGTGKELIARAIHNLSRRKTRALIKVNCAAIPSGLVESELFGHEKGAFTGALTQKIGRFELADKGTIFLDEIAELPLDLQPKLLRVLQEGEFERVGGTRTIKVDVRIISATNRNLDVAVQEGRFREDLFYRLNVFPVTLPPLRERQDDIAPLARYFAIKYGKRLGKEIEQMPHKVLDALKAHPWPGNIRELENVIERAIITSQGPQLELGDALPQRSVRAQGKELLTLEEMERNHITAVLKSTDWQVSGRGGAAELLGMKPTTLDSRIKKLGIKKRNGISGIS
jgi:transcriptional regulator with GAF, ATPase, and Fis domain